MTARPRRCPACRLAGRENGGAQMAATTLYSGWFVRCPECDLAGPVSDDQQDAIDEWNNLAHAAKIAERVGPRGRAKKILADARDLVGRGVYIEWTDGADWHWYDLLDVTTRCLLLRGRTSPEGDQWFGGPWKISATNVRRIRELREDER